MVESWPLARSGGNKLDGFLFFICKGHAINDFPFSDAHFLQDCLEKSLLLIFSALVVGTRSYSGFWMSFSINSHQFDFSWIWKNLHMRINPTRQICIFVFRISVLYTLPLLYFLQCTVRSQIQITVTIIFIMFIDYL